MRSAAIALAIALVAAGIAPAHADEPAPAPEPKADADRATGIIALLPLAADKKLAIYGQPVASEVARALEQAGFTIVVVSTSAPVPSKARLVIDGRIVRGDGESVLLEARVRDPALGTIVASLSVTAPSLTRIDQGAADLVAGLEPVLRDGLAAQDRAAKRRAGGKTKVEADPTRTTGGDGAAVTHKTDERPLAVVNLAYPASLDGVTDAPPMKALLSAGVDRLASLVGHRTEPAKSEDLAVAVMTQHAKLGVSIKLLSISYSGDGVITARARARVRVVAGDRVLFDRVVRTDTLVGGRGDRKDAVARAAIDQIVDIAYGRVRQELTP